MIYRLPSCVFGIIIGYDRDPVVNPPGFHWNVTRLLITHLGWKPGIGSA